MKKGRFLCTYNRLWGKKCYGFLFARMIFFFFFKYYSTLSWTLSFIWELLLSIGKRVIKKWISTSSFVKKKKDHYNPGIQYTFCPGWSWYCFCLFSTFIYYGTISPSTWKEYRDIYCEFWSFPPLLFWDSIFSPDKKVCGGRGEAIFFWVYTPKRCIFKPFFPFLM